MSNILSNVCDIFIMSSGYINDSMIIKQFVINQSILSFASSICLFVNTLIYCQRFFFRKYSVTYGN